VEANDQAVRSGLNPDQARELVREEWAFLPDEEDVRRVPSERDPRSWRTYQDGALRARRARRARRTPSRPRLPHHRPNRAWSGQSARENPWTSTSRASTGCVRRGRYAHAAAGRPSVGDNPSGRSLHDRRPGCARRRTGAPLGDQIRCGRFGRARREARRPRHRGRGAFPRVRHRSPQRASTAWSRSLGLWRLSHKYLRFRALTFATPGKRPQEVSAYRTYNGPCP
jgi:hypothetical protein